MESVPQLSYKCVVVTPAGRRRYIEILYRYLKSQRAQFNTWQLWLNTTVQEDIEYMRMLERENSWIKCIKAEWPINGNYSIGHFFRHTITPDTIYIRLDDDVVYLEPDFIRTLYTQRLLHKEPLFVYPNIINNAIVSHLHYKNNLIAYSAGVPGYDCLDNHGWKSGEFSEAMHAAFIDSIKTNKIDKWKSSFTTHVPVDYARVSINSIAWFGSIMGKIYHLIPRGDEEQNIAVIIPKLFKTPNLIVNTPLCAHFAFFTQRKHLEEHTTVLQQYAELANALE
jgi:hypothetical protein